MTRARRVALALGVPACLALTAWGAFSIVGITLVYVFIALVVYVMVYGKNRNPLDTHAGRLHAIGVAVKSGVYMWKYFSSLRNRFHIFVANDPGVDGAGAYRTAVRALQWKGFPPPSCSLNTRAA